MKQIEDFLGYRIVQVCQENRQRASEALDGLGVHVGQEMILFQLWNEEGITQYRVAEQLCVEPPTVTKMLQRMETAGLVERRPDACDARVSRVYFTEQRRALEQPVLDAWRCLEERTLRACPRRSNCCCSD